MALSIKDGNVHIQKLANTFDTVLAYKKPKIGHSLSEATFNELKNRPITLPIHDPLTILVYIGVPDNVLHYLLTSLEPVLGKQTYVGKNLQVASIVIAPARN